MRRVRDTHGKFAALNAATAPADDEEQGGDGAPYGPSATGAGPRASGLAAVAATSFGVGDDDVADDKIDESPWTPGKRQNEVNADGHRIRGGKFEGLFAMDNEQDSRAFWLSRSVHLL